MTTPNRITLLHLWSVHHPRDFVRRVEDLLTDLYERVEKLEAIVIDSGKPLTEQTCTRCGMSIAWDDSPNPHCIPLCVKPEKATKKGEKP